MIDNNQNNPITRLTANFIAFIISIISLYLLFYGTNWKVIVGIFLFVWANNIVMKYDIMKTMEKQKQP